MTSARDGRPRAGHGTAIRVHRPVGTADYPGAVLSRIDLRPSPAASRCPGRRAPRAACRGRRVDVDAVVERVRPMIDAVRDRGVDGGAGVHRALRPRPPADASACRRRRCAEALDARRPAGARGPRDLDRARPGGARRPAPHRHHHPGRARRHGHRALGAGRARRALRPRRARGLPVERGHERRPGAGRRGRGPRRLLAAAAEFGGRPHPPILAAAALLGVDEVWAVGGAQAVALLAYGGTDTDGAELEPVDMVTGPGNVYVTAAKRLLRGPIGIDSEAGPTEIAILADETADPVHVAADLISQAEHDPVAASRAGHDERRRWPTPSTPSWPRRSATTKHDERIRTALTGPQSGTILVADLDDGLRVVDAYAAEHLEIQTADAARRRRAGPQRRRGLRRPAQPGLAGRLLRRVEPRPAHRRLRPALQRPVGADVPARHPRRRLLRRGAGRGRRPRGRPRRRRGSARPRPGRAAAVRGAAVTAASERDVVGAACRSRTCRCARTCAAQPVRRAAAAGPGRAEHQREPVPAAGGAGRRRRRSRRGEAAASLHRYPDRDHVALRDGARRLPDPRHRRPARDREPVGRQRLQRGAPAAAAGLRRAGRPRAGLRAVVLDAPDPRGRHPHRLGAGAAARRLLPRRGRRAVAVVRERGARRRCS